MTYPYDVSTEQDESTTGLGLAARIAAPAATVRPNEAGIAASLHAEAVEESPSPRLVIRGESSWKEIITEGGERYALVMQGKHLKVIELPQPLPEGVGSAALVDYLNCTFPFGGESSLAELFGGLFQVLGRSFAPATNRNRGLHGYQHSFSLGQTSAQFAYGGNGGTGFLSLPGATCHQIPDWPRLVSYLRDDPHARITRFDGAVDDYKGIHSVDSAVEMYRQGLFNAGGRKPLISQMGNWLEPDGTGRTFYLGKRESGKMLRIYEKGMQLGIPWHPWVRWELELHNTDRVIPWDAVLEPGKYVAGAYPKALSWISEEQSRIRTLRRTAKIGYDTLTHWASVAYGKHIDVMMAVEGSAEKVIERLRREGFPTRLDLPPLPGYGKVYPSCDR